MTRQEVIDAAEKVILPFRFLKTDPVETDQSKPIHNVMIGSDPVPHCWSCENGFDGRYEVPLSRGGVYPTRSDLNMLFHLSSRTGFRQLVGGRMEWNERVVQGQGGYSKGAFIRNSDGYEKVSTQDNNRAELPKGTESSTGWSQFRNRPSIFSDDLYADAVTPIRDRQTGRPSADYYYYRLPQTDVTTKQKWFGFCVPYDAMIVFTPFMIGYGTDRSTGKGYELDGYICSQRGSCVLRISPYDDIYENEDHKEKSFIALSCYGNGAAGKRITKQPMIPLKAGIYYLYVEYVNGCFVCQESPDRYNFNVDDFHLCARYFRTHLRGTKL